MEYDFFITLCAAVGGLLVSVAGIGLMRQGYRWTKWDDMGVGMFLTTLGAATLGCGIWGIVEKFTQCLAVC